jgi:scyllo-inositol 2-dehydrogenase (NADP+)
MMPPITVGLIGYGGAGATFHAPVIRALPELRLKSIVSSRRQQIEKMPGVAAVSTVADLLADPEIQLVVLASPTATHFEIALECLHAGKHLVIDKPITVTVAQAEEVMDLAHRQGCALSVFQSRRWDGDFLTVKRLIAEGALGTVYSFEAHYDRFRPKVQVRWRESPGEGAGILYDLGSHVIDQALHLFGMPRAITADAFPQRPGCETVDYFHLVLDYGRLRAILHASVLTVEPGPHFSVHGDCGSYLKYGMDPQENALKAGGGPNDAGWGGEPPEVWGELVCADGSRRRVPTEPGCYEEFYRRMAAHLISGAPVPVDPADSRDGLKIIEAATRSATERRTVDLA